MAAIVHRCTCTHLDHVHATHPTKDDTRPCTMSGCPCPDSAPAAPELIPTWAAASPFATALPDPAVLEPGTADGFGRLCDCEDCWSLYDTTGGQAA
ncbi:hypothetical protein [Amycolatopsis rifamycinica]|uniref:Uncharacterized protein n=1 Tax=Amycolatopsis rifamycinica TaxID=287986 RepID=A0A066U819_9PSEU|nr:hypothetical protein [Amycolatopsis rifamycinica]KDN23205.1 hypothetical protein DV20_05670 [Amycolatopsis rifamycinica]